MNKQIQISKLSFWGLMTVLIILYLYFGYYLKRENFFILFVVYTGMFSGFVLLLFSNQKYKFIIGLFLRLLLFFQIPNLSQDFYRFIWDGRLMISGINPYSFLPVNHVQSVFDGDFLLQKMGNLSANNFSNYPPLNQLFFAFGSFFFPKNIMGNVVVLRSVIILADIGIYFYGRKLLEMLKLPKDRIHLYFLNPLVIIELTGNLHFEGLMMFFLCLSLYYYFKSQIEFSAIFMALAVIIKLIPLIFLPLFMKSMPPKKLIFFYLIIGLICTISFIPFLNSQFIQNYSNTIGLWFTNFEFNASLYYVIREVGYWITGYNIIGITGRITPIIIILYVLYLSSRKSELLPKQYLVLMIYFFLSTTVHPWYLISMIFIGVFLQVKAIWVWSFTVILSYSAYSGVQFGENPVFIFFEYLPVFIMFFYEKGFSKIKALPSLF